jgi:hypothetical protein
MRKLTQQIRNVFGSIYNLFRTIILIPFSQSNRYKIGEAYNLLKNPFHGPQTVALNTLLKNENLEVKISPLKANEHNTTEFELLAITAILKDKDCNTVFEIGTYDGRTTRAMAMNLHNTSGKIYTINLPSQTKQVALSTSILDIELASKQKSGERFLNRPEQQYIEQLWGDSATFDFAPYYHKMDLVFIDGAHSEFYVKNDTARAIQMLKPFGGWILWHDAPHFGVAKFLKKWISEGNRPVYFIKNTTLAIAFVRNGKVINPQD